MPIVAAILAGFGFLVVVFKFAAEHGTCYGTQNAVAAHLVAAKVSGSTTTHSAQEASITLLLHSWVAGSILLLARLAVGVLALRVLVLAIRTLLRKLVLRLRAGVTSLLVLAILPDSDIRKVVSKHWVCLYIPLLLLLLVVVTVLADLLAMLEATLRRRTILRVVTLLVCLTLLAILLLRLLVLLLVAALFISTSLLRVGAVPLGWILLLLLAVALVVLIVSRHVQYSYESRYGYRGKCVVVKLCTVRRGSWKDAGG